jgi:hypothetical protein
MRLEWLGVVHPLIWIKLLLRRKCRSPGSALKALPDNPEWPGLRRQYARLEVNASACCPQNRQIAFVNSMFIVGHVQQYTRSRVLARLAQTLCLSTRPDFVRKGDEVREPSIVDLYQRYDSGHTG